MISVETSYPRKKEPPKGFLDAIVGDTKRQVENKRVEEVVTAGSIDMDLQRAIEVSFLLTLSRLFVHQPRVSFTGTREIQCSRSFASS